MDKEKLNHTFEYRMEEDSLIIDNIQINPDLGVSVVIPFAEEIKDYLEEVKPEKIIFDLQNLNSIDSTIIQSLLNVKKIYSQNPIYLKNLPSAYEKRLESVGLFNYFERLS